MEVKDGYKKTEIGVIPVDWDVKPLEYLCKPSGLVRGPFGGALKKEYFVKSGYKVYEQRNAIYKNSNIGNYYINKDKFDELARFAVKQGDFIISCSGTIGKIFQIPKNHKQGVINQALLKLTIDSSKAVDKFFEVYFSWDRFQDKIIDSTQGGAMKNLVGMDVFKKTLIAIPPIPEQQAIAEALSDVDAVVSSLTKLINKKKNIKQGAMKELLTGKKRLEGFTGEWGKVRLGDVGKFISGSGFPLKYQSSKIDKYPFYKVSDFNNVGNGIYMKNANNYINEDVRITLSAKVIPKNAIIFAKIGAAIFLERKRIALYECCIDNNMMCFVSDSSILNEKFAYYIFQNNNLSDFNNATALPSLNAKAIGELAILVPPTVIEQTAIANILSDMDAEIEALEQKLSKYKAIKQGMMHELLNGRIRLI